MSEYNYSAGISRTETFSNQMDIKVNNWETISDITRKSKKFSSLDFHCNVSRLKAAIHESQDAFNN